MIRCAAWQRWVERHWAAEQCFAAFLSISKNKKAHDPVMTESWVIWWDQIRCEYFPDTHPTQLLTTTACQPFSAVAAHSKVSPSLAAVMRLY